MAKIEVEELSLAKLDGCKSLAAALARMEEALTIHDVLAAAGDIGAHLDLAAYRLRELMLLSVS